MIAHYFLLSKVLYLRHLGSPEFDDIPWRLKLRPRLSDKINLAGELRLLQIGHQLQVRFEISHIKLVFQQAMRIGGKTSMPLNSVSVSSG